MTRTLLSVALSALLLATVYSLDLENTKELPCFNVTNSVPVDGAWATGIEAIYYIMMSRGDLYRAAADLLQRDPKTISESEVYYKSCMKWNIYTNGTITARGFGNYTRDYTAAAIKPAPLEEFSFRPSEGKIWGYAGTKYTTMTDNSTFLFTPFCTDDGQMTWGVGATTPTLPKETVERVLTHAEELGFNREEFVHVNYDHCGFSNEI